MGKKILLFFVLSLFLVSFVSAQSADPCRLSVSLINQDPYPAAPNSYVKLVFQVSGVENPACEGAKFEFVPNYPFSLDKGEEALRILDRGSTYVLDYSNNWMVAYKVRVDKDAIEGENTVKIRYAISAEGPVPYISKKFVVYIEDTRTSFDAVIQDVSSSEVSIALANVGKYDANSVVIRIPEQEDFRTIKTNAQMVGNLESGDYTLASFELTRNIDRSALTKDSAEEDTKMTPAKREETTLKFDIYYTDNIGERRIVNMELPLMTSYFFTSEEASGQIIPGGGKFAMRQQQSSMSWWKYALMALAAGLVIFIAYKKFPRKTGGLLSKLKLRKNRHKSKSESIPDWVRKEKK